MKLVSLMVGVGRSLGTSGGFIKFGIPLFAVLGVGVLAYLGVRGIARRDTWLLMRRSGGFRVTGGWAIALGSFYCLKAMFLAAVLAPFSYGLLSA